MRRIVLAAAVLLAGCAGGPFKSGPVTEVPASNDSAVAAIADWRVDGRIAIQRGSEGWSAKLRWHQDSDRYRMRLIAPLGRGTYQLEGDARSVELQVPDGRTFVADDAESLMLEHLGWSIPIAGAEYWMRGIAAPGDEPEAVRRDDAGYLTDLDQHGWRVSILRRMAAGGFVLPAKLFMHYGDLKVRIVVAQWILNPA